jgi:hypothetical protein
MAAWSSPPKWGAPLYPDTVTALMTKLINAHNRSVSVPSQALPHARLHDLRHLHATTLLLAGVPVHIVAARLGHADPAVTLRVYSHVLREHALAVAGRRLISQSDLHDCRGPSPDVAGRLAPLAPSLAPRLAPRIGRRRVHSGESVQGHRG